MESLNIYELDLICRELGRCRGGRLQELRFSGTHFEWAFWVGGQKSWWHLSMEALTPLLLPVSQPKLSKKSQNKPIYLFLKAHALGKKLETFKRCQKLGRVLFMTLKGADSSCEIEMRLFPHGQNLIVRGSGKQLSMKPIKVLEALEGLKVPETCRSLSDLESEFKLLNIPSSVFSPEKLLARQMAKLEKSIEKVSQDLERKKQLPWRQVGDYLVQTQGLEVPDEWASYVDLKESLAWNIENCFAKAKANVHKIAGGEARRTELQRKLQEMGEGGAQPPLSVERRLKPMGVKARKMNFEGGLEAWIGKSARENIKLLRQAKAWDMWIHLADYPSSHGIIRRSKGAKIPSSVLLDVGRWMVRTTFGQKSKNYQGDRFEILYTECRYVSPIKGDKIGRVTYRNEKVMGFKF